jgi:hypothetical protein
MLDEAPMSDRPSPVQLAAWLRAEAEPFWRLAADPVWSLSDRQKAGQRAAWLDEAARLIETTTPQSST